MSRWAQSAWKELWGEIPQVWFWLAWCIALPWAFLSAAGVATWVCAAVCVPLGIVLYVLTWGRPQ